MKTTYKEFKKMSLRPAFYNGTQFDIDVIFDGADLHREGVTPTKALNMIVGDTVRVRGKVKSDKKDNNYDQFIDFRNRNNRNYTHRSHHRSPLRRNQDSCADARHRPGRKIVPRRYGGQGGYDRQKRDVEGG